MTLPPLPATTIEVVEDRTATSRCDDGFIRLRRSQMRCIGSDGTTSDPFAYDEVQRSALDAVVIAAHFRDSHGIRHVYLRSALRPPVALRPRKAWPMPERGGLGQLWEVPAGLVEVGEQSVQGLRECAARELAEELGLVLAPEQMLPLGPPSFPAPALIGERHFYFHCEVDPVAQTTPAGDGSPLERDATVVAVPLEEALSLVRSGEIEDAKTEVALRRLAEISA